ncbi:heavy-metal-associated domain-containing protein [Acetivibrio cellulolyticus]|uniref:heavy-metal-associated domain-containing protein n=1 Tax=Acetivibrio cellulolyticus TaxID=35830 RepID=UPI0001E2F0C8|nr:heavy metal-associated domain-containing protein [Acetivibrio cellulolyticus]
MKTATFNIPSISCSACSNKIQEGVKTLTGVQNVSIDLKSQQVKVDYNPENIMPQEIKMHISQMGYEII